MNGELEHADAKHLERAPSRGPVRPAPDEAALLRHYTLSDRQQRKLCRMHAMGEYSISDLAELFSVSRPTVYRTLNRCHSP